MFTNAMEYNQEGSLIYNVSGRAVERIGSLYRLRLGRSEC